MSFTSSIRDLDRRLRALRRDARPAESAALEAIDALLADASRAADKSLTATGSERKYHRNVFEMRMQDATKRLAELERSRT